MPRIWKIAPPSVLAVPVLKITMKTMMKGRTGTQKEAVVSAAMVLAEEDDEEEEEEEEEPSTGCICPWQVGFGG